MVTLRIGVRLALTACRAGPAGRDAVPDGDLLRADEDVLDEQPQHLLAVLDGGGGGVAAQLEEQSRSLEVRPAKRVNRIRRCRPGTLVTEQTGDTGHIRFLNPPRGKLLKPRRKPV